MDTFLKNHETQLIVVGSCVAVLVFLCLHIVIILLLCKNKKRCSICNRSAMDEEGRQTSDEETDIVMSDLSMLLSSSPLTVQSKESRKHRKQSPSQGSSSDDGVNSRRNERRIKQKQRKSQRSPSPGFHDNKSSMISDVLTPAVYNEMQTPPKHSHTTESDCRWSDDTKPRQQPPPQASSSRSHRSTDGIPMKEICTVYDYVARSSSYDKPAWSDKHHSSSFAKQGNSQTLKSNISKEALASSNDDLSGDVSSSQGNRKRKRAMDCQLVSQVLLSENMHPENSRSSRNNNIQSISWNKTAPRSFIRKHSAPSNNSYIHNDFLMNVLKRSSSPSRLPDSNPHHIPAPPQNVEPPKRVSFEQTPKLCIGTESIFSGTSQSTPLSVFPLSLTSQPQKLYRQAESVAIDMNEEGPQLLGALPALFKQPPSLPPEKASKLHSSAESPCYSTGQIIPPPPNPSFQCQSESSSTSDNPVAVLADPPRIIPSSLPHPTSPSPSFQYQSESSSTSGDPANSISSAADPPQIAPPLPLPNPPPSSPSFQNQSGSSSTSGDPAYPISASADPPNIAPAPLPQPPPPSPPSFQCQSRSSLTSEDPANPISSAADPPQIAPPLPHPPPQSPPSLECQSRSSLTSRDPANPVNSLQDVQLHHTESSLYKLDPLGTNQDTHVQSLMIRRTLRVIQPNPHADIIKAAMAARRKRLSSSTAFNNSNTSSPTHADQANIQTSFPGALSFDK